jgi:hypothetical protein
MVLTVSFALSPVTGFLATVAPEKLASQELDASVGASGPHDFAVRLTRHSSKALQASTASRPTLMTWPTPLCRDGTAESIKLFLPIGEAKYFCERGWTAK